MLPEIRYDTAQLQLLAAGSASCTVTTFSAFFFVGVLRAIFPFNIGSDSGGCYTSSRVATAAVALRRVGPFLLLEGKKGIRGVRSTSVVILFRCVQLSFQPFHNFVRTLLCTAI